MEENGQRKQQATLWWGTEVGKPEEGSLLFVKSTGDALDRCSCKLTKVLFTTGLGTVKFVLVWAEPQERGPARGKMVKLLSFATCNTRLFTCCIRVWWGPCPHCEPLLRANWTEGFWTPDWNSAFSEMDCQFAKGGRALGISDIGFTQECKKLFLFLQLTVVNGGSAREFARWKVLYASGLISYVHLGKSEPWEPTTWVPCSGREAFFAVSWSASEREPAAEGVYLLSLPYPFCTRGTSRRQK